MNTETTDKVDAVLMYDELCAFCRGWARRLGPVLCRRGVGVRPLPEQSDEMLLRTGEGEVFGGADAAVWIARKIWWAWPVWALSRLPGMMPVLRWGYRRVAANRDCLGGVCTVGRASRVTGAERNGQAGRSSHFGWLPVAVLVLAARPFFPGWVFMWVLAAGLFAGIKWVMWRRGLAWPGWEADGALGQRALPNILLGAILFWGVARWLPALAAGWVGMIGFALMLHFGLARSIMNEPWRSRSVGEFWGKRWNTAFPAFARPVVFEPVRRRFGNGAATLAVFVVSGLLHELVISVPAGGGLGLPTGYFVVQGLAVLAERKWRSRSRQECRSHKLHWLVIAGPAFWLFHPRFVERVVLPMMEALKAL